MTQAPTTSCVPPYSIVRVDQFEGHCEDGYSLPYGNFGTLEEAINHARLITENAIEFCGSVEKWDGMGDAGLVYDGRGMLIWSGVQEYRQSSPTRKEPDDHGTTNKAG